MVELVDALTQNPVSDEDVFVDWTTAFLFSSFDDYFRLRK